MSGKLTRAQQLIDNPDQPCNYRETVIPQVFAPQIRPAPAVPRDQPAAQPARAAAQPAQADAARGDGARGRAARAEPQPELEVKVALSWAQQVERFWEIIEGLPKPISRATATAHLNRLVGAERVLFRDVYYNMHDSLDRVFAVKELYVTADHGSAAERATIVSNYIAEGRGTYNNMIEGADGEMATVTWIAKNDYGSFNPFYQWIPRDMLHKDLA